VVATDGLAMGWGHHVCASFASPKGAGRNAALGPSRIGAGRAKAKDARQWRTSGCGAPKEGGNLRADFPVEEYQRVADVVKSSTYVLN
jgi:hypothetical protein